MRVTLLGTSSAEGWPALFCACTACCSARTLGGRNIRTRSSALIDDVLKIDFPPDILHQVIANNIDLTRMRALLITHAHNDHLAPAELQYRGPFFSPMAPEMRLPVYGPVDAVESIRRGLTLDAPMIDLITLEPWRAVAVEGYQVTPILAQHDPDSVCFNYIIEESEGAGLLYATDTGWYNDETWEFLESRRLACVVVECTKGPQEGGYMAHMSISDVVRLRTRLIAADTLNAATPVVVTHLSHLGGLMHAELEAALNPHGITVGYDGMGIEVAQVK